MTITTSVTNNALPVTKEKGERTISGGDVLNPSINCLYASPYDCPAITILYIYYVKRNKKFEERESIVSSVVNTPVSLNSPLTDTPGSQDFSVIITPSIFRLSCVSGTSIIIR